MSSFISSVDFFCFLCCFVCKFTPSNLSVCLKRAYFYDFNFRRATLWLIYRKKVLWIFILMSLFFFLFRCLKYISLGTKYMFVKWNLCTTMALKICFSLKLKLHDEGKCLIKCFFFCCMVFPFRWKTKEKLMHTNHFLGHYRYFLWLFLWANKEIFLFWINKSFWFSNN